LTTIYVDPIGRHDGAAIRSAYDDMYRNETFVRLLDDARLPDTKNVTGTNFIDVAWRIDPRTGRLVVMSAIDNLIKGTSGQAIQCFNLMRGYPETAGLI
jgi:N-acetyl-gamma-glutamyl-phosphate reductase